MTPEHQAKLLLDRYLPLVEREIRRVLEGRPDSLLYQMIRYHLGWAAREAAPQATGDRPASGGKRIRPILCLLACEVVGGEASLAAPAAAGIELVHAFALLHDDVADRDEVRRAQPTVWRLWGIGQAITAGDAIYALANLAVSRLDSSRVPATTVATVQRELNEAALALCEGQQLDLSYEGRSDLRVGDYLEMIAGKTAALFAAATSIGAQIGGAAQETAEHLGRFGHHVGLAFQIRDDILGLWGDPADLGKPVGSDLRRNKRSLPILHAVTTTEPRGELAARLAGGVANDEEASALAAQIEDAGSRAFCEDLARESLGRALEELAGVGLRDESVRDLRILAGYLAERTR